MALKAIINAAVKALPRELRVSSSAVVQQIGVVVDVDGGLTAAVTDTISLEWCVREQIAIDVMADGGSSRMRVDGIIFQIKSDETELDVTKTYRFKEGTTILSLTRLTKIAPGTGGVYVYQAVFGVGGA